MAFFQFHVPTRIISDAGISKDFGHECQQLGIDQLFVVTDKVLRSLGLIEPILDGLRAAGIGICGEFSDVPSDSSVATVQHCAALAKECGASGFLAIGGGSVMDTAKGANILFTLGGDLKHDYSGAQTITQNLSPLIAIPTTAGTGSEVTEAIVIYDEESQTKLSFVDKHLLPTLAVLDPELTLKLPKQLTAATALDALTHAIESCLSVQKSRISDALAYQAIRLIRESLPQVLADGSDVEHRANLLVASNLAGMAFNHAMVGVVHAVAHSVGALAHVHHGTANAIFLPYGLEYNCETVSTELTELARATLTVSDGSGSELPLEFIRQTREFVLAMSTQSGLPTSYKAAGVDVGLLDQICELAVEDGAGFYNPRPLTVEELKPFLQKAFG